jgi:hypothetical protein
VRHARWERFLFDLELAIYIIETKSGRKIQKLAVHVCAMCGHFYDLLCLTLTQQMGSTCPCTWLRASLGSVAEAWLTARWPERLTSRIGPFTPAKTPRGNPHCVQICSVWWTNKDFMLISSSHISHIYTTFSYSLNDAFQRKIIIIKLVWLKTFQHFWQFQNMSAAQLIFLSTT